jgi:hypothetical protein
MLTEKERVESQGLPDSLIEKEIDFSVEEEMELKQALDDHCNEMDKIVDNFSKSFQVRSYLFAYSSVIHFPISLSVFPV